MLLHSVAPFSMDAPQKDRKTLTLPPKACILHAFGVQVDHPQVPCRGILPIKIPPPALPNTELLAREPGAALTVLVQASAPESQDLRGPKDHIKIRILHSGSTAQEKRIPEIMDL